MQDKNRILNIALNCGHWMCAQLCASAQLHIAASDINAIPIPCISLLHLFDLNCICICIFLLWPYFCYEWYDFFVFMPLHIDFRFTIKIQYTILMRINIYIFFLSFFGFLAFNWNSSQSLYHVIRLETSQQFERISVHKCWLACWSAYATPTFMHTQHKNVAYEKTDMENSNKKNEKIGCRPC